MQLTNALIVEPVNQVVVEPTADMAGDIYGAGMDVATGSVTGETVGILVGNAALMAAPEAAVGARGAAQSARAVPRAYTVAARGGRHSGYLQQLRRQNIRGIERGIRSRESRIREHQEKIRNPERHMQRDDPNDPQAVERAREDWREEIRNFEEQNDIAREELRRRRQ